MHTNFDDVSITHWLFCSANRGIGLELARQLLTVSTNIVVATCRNPNGAADLHALKGTAQGTLHIAPIDVSSEESIRNSVPIVQAALGDGGIDVLYNNAAVVRSHVLSDHPKQA